MYTLILDLKRRIWVYTLSMSALPNVSMQQISLWAKAGVNKLEVVNSEIFSAEITRVAASKNLIWEDGIKTRDLWGFPPKLASNSWLIRNDTKFSLL